MRGQQGELSDAPGSKASWRASNQQRVVDMLRRESDSESISQADIVRATQLAPATVSKIIKDLSAAGMVETTTVGGRRGMSVRIGRTAGLVASVDVGDTHLRVAVGDLGGHVLSIHTRELRSSHTHTEALAAARSLLDGQLVDLESTLDTVAHLVLSVPTPVVHDSLAMTPSFLPGWVDVDARAETERAFGRPTTVENDANLGALAEHRLGAGRGHSSMAYVRVSAGVCAGLILDGRIFRGAHGMAGELGHLTFDDRGPLCRCGNRGCLEAYASVHLATQATADHGVGASIEDFIVAAGEGHRGALRMFEDAGTHLGWGLAMLVNILNPSCLVIGGQMAQAGEALLEPIRVGLRRHALASASQGVAVVRDLLGDDAAAIGGLQLAMESTNLRLAAGERESRPSRTPRDGDDAE